MKVFNDDRIFEILIGGEFNKLCNLHIATIQRELGQTNKTILFENLAKMYGYCGEEQKGFVWLINPSLFIQLNFLCGCVGTMDIPIFSAAESNGEYTNYLLGLPVIWLNSLPGIGEGGEIMLFDIKKFFKEEKCVILLRKDSE